MTDFDDELAALLALDALEAGEQADAELRLGTFGDLAEASAALAEFVVTAPPADLRATALEQARAERAPGRPVDAAEPCEPAEAFDRTVADFGALLDSLSDSDWELTAHPEHGRIRDLVAHLIGVERLSVRWLDPDDQVPELLDHVAATRPVVESLTNAPPEQLRADWLAAARAVAEAAAANDPDRRVTFHDITTSVPGLLTMRTFELWAHSMDIATALARPLPVLDPERMAILSSRLMAALPLALAYRGNAVPGSTARFVLTGSAGGCYNVSLDPRSAAGEPDVLVVADTVALCRIAARRLAPSELGATIEGNHDLANLVLADLDAFARD